MFGTARGIWLSHREHKLLSRYAKDPREVDVTQMQSNVFHCRLYRAICSDFLRQLDRKTLRVKLYSLLTKLSKPKNKIGLATFEHSSYHYYDDLLVKVRRADQGLAEQRLLYFKRYQSLIVFESTLFSISAKEFVARMMNRLSFWEAWETRKLAAQIGYHFRHYLYCVGMYGERVYEPRATSSTEFHRFQHHDKLWQLLKDGAQSDLGSKDDIFPDYKN